MGGRRVLLATAASMVFAAALIGQSYAASKGAAHLNNRNGIRHVMLISIDGMHALDLVNCSKGDSPSCPNLAQLRNMRPIIWTPPPRSLRIRSPG